MMPPIDSGRSLRRRSAAIEAAVCLLLAVAGAGAEAEQLEPRFSGELDAGSRGIVVSRLRLRSQPSLEGRILRSLPAGEKLDILARQGDWLRAGVAATTAWVDASHLRIAGSTGVTTERLNLRTGPGVEQAWTGVLAEGAEVEILDTSGGWVRVTLAAAEGWLHANYVLLRDEPPTPLLAKTGHTAAENPATTRPVLPAPGPLPVTGPVVDATPGAETRAADDGPPDELYPETQPRIMAIYLNRRQVSPGTRLWMSPDEILVPLELVAQWRLRDDRFQHQVIDGRAYADLRSVGGLETWVDEAQQEIWLEADTQLFQTTRMGLSRSRYQKPQKPSLGGFAHYDLSATSLPGRSKLDGDFELGLFGRLGTASTRMIARRGDSDLRLVRLASTWTIDLPSRKQSLRLGDSQSRPGSWWQPVQVAGISWASDFTTQPGFVPYALPTITGEATLASELELYLGEVLRARQQIPIGPFELHDLPVVSGDGTFQVVIRDQLGRETVLTRQFYVSPSLLRAGLREFHHTLGALRRDFGVASDAYGQPAFVGTERYGLTNRFTLEWHGEILEDHQLMGIGGTAAIGKLGIANLTLATSQRPGGRARLWQYGLDRQAKRINFGFQVQQAEPEFRRLGFGGSSAAPTKSIRARTSVSLGRVGALSMAYTARQLAERPDFESLSVNLSSRVGHKLYLNVFALAIRRPQEGHSISFTLTRPLGPTKAIGTRLSTSSSADDRVGVRYQKARGRGAGISYTLSAETGDVSRANAAVEIGSSAGSLVVEGVHNGSTQGMRTSWRGSLVTIAGQLHASRLTNRSFGLVSTSGVEGIRVYHQNHLIGQTNRRGYLVVPGLLPYQPNRIRIRDEDLPFGARIGALEHIVAPFSRSGLLVQFPIETSRSALLTLHQESGEPVPVGAGLRSLRTGEVFPVAHDGQVYVTGLADRDHFEATWAERACRLDFFWPEGVELEARPEPIICRSQP